VTTLDGEWLVSADDHVVEPPNVWQDRLPAKHREQGPRMIEDDGVEYWVFEDKRRPARGLEATAGKRFEEFSPLPLAYKEMRPGCYDVKARIADMDEGRVLAAVVFPSFPRFAGQVFSEASDRELGFACIQAYNDWMLDEWCGYAPGRFIPMTMIPFWDAKLAAQEIERCAGKGARCITFSENPAALGWPSIHHPSHYWDPMFAACAEAELTINMHAGSSSRIPKTSDDMPYVEALVWGPMVVPSGAACDYLFSDVFVRHPQLKICLSEGGIGWIPTMLERCDRVYDRQRFWAMAYDIYSDQRTGVIEKRPLKQVFDERRPTDIFREHIYGCFFEDFVGVESMKSIGLLDNIVLETDYPHSDTTWPNTMELAERQLAPLSREEAQKVLVGNACKLYHFEPATPPGAPGRTLQNA
jgi:predicted TIM-barrel fold metal-dependent hydrolase